MQTEIQTGIAYQQPDVNVKRLETTVNIQRVSLHNALKSIKYKSFKVVEKFVRSAVTSDDSRQ